MAMDVKGTLIEVLKLESGVSKAGKEWQKRDFVIETDDQYPKKIAFTLFSDKVSLIDGIELGSELEVFFNIESREYNGKYFHNINCWKLNVVQSVVAGSGLTQKSEMQAPPPEANSDADNLPF